MNFNFIVLEEEGVSRPLQIDFKNQKVLLLRNTFLGKKEKWLPLTTAKLVLESDIADINGDFLYDGCYAQVLDTYYCNGEQQDHYFGQVVFDNDGWKIKILKKFKSTRRTVYINSYVRIRETAKIKRYSHMLQFDKSFTDLGDLKIK